MIELCALAIDYATTAVKVNQNTVIDSINTSLSCVTSLPDMHARFVHNSVKGTLKAIVKSTLIAEITFQKPHSAFFVPRKCLF